MIPTLSFVRETFDKYNSKIFNSGLPVPRFAITTARSFRGKLFYRIRRNGLTVRNHDFEIRISRNFNLPEEEWEDVVIHEMIHLHIAANHIPDTSSHGPVFRKMMHDINRRFGRKINISVRTDAATSADSQVNNLVKAHYICLARFSDGRLGVAPVAKTRIFELWNSFQNFPNMTALKWIGSIDPWFNAFPHVRKPKFYIVKEEDLLPHLKGAVIMQRKDKSISPINRRYSPDELLP